MKPALPETMQFSPLRNPESEVAPNPHLRYQLIPGVQPAPPQRSPTFILPSSVAPLRPTSTRLESNNSHPHVFYVPTNAPHVLNFSAPNTPECRALGALLSTMPARNSVALFGMGGAGKTTTLKALGYLPGIWHTFNDGIWFIEVGHDITLAAFINQLKQLVQVAFPDFYDQFVQLSASQQTHERMIARLLDLLSTKHFLLILDDVWDVVDTVYDLVTTICVAVRHTKRTSFKVLTSTRKWNVGQMHDVPINLNPVEKNINAAQRILCCHAGIHMSSLSSLTHENHIAFNRIINMCAGLPLALSVAGSSVLEMTEPSDQGSARNYPFAQYWESLEKNIAQFANASVDKHDGLLASLGTSLQILENDPEFNQFKVRPMFRSLSVLRKNSSISVSALEKLWGVDTDTVRNGVLMFSRNNLATMIKDTDNTIVGLSTHDLIHDMSVSLAKQEEGVSFWHHQLINAYLQSVDLPVYDEQDGKCNHWWMLQDSDYYIMENVVRHLLGARKGLAALRLLTDYRWIQVMNQDEKQVAFQKVIEDLKLLSDYAKKLEDVRIQRKLSKELDVIAETMVLCMIPYCMKNRSECSYQLYGRLKSLGSPSSIVKRMIWSIEKYADRPWVRAPAGVLRNANSDLKRVFDVEQESSCMEAAVGKDELVVGGTSGSLQVISSRDGSPRHILIGHESQIVGISFDEATRDIYSCDKDGTIIIWRNYQQFCTYHLENLAADERLTCLHILNSQQVFVVGSSIGRLITVQCRNGSILKTVRAHSSPILCLLTMNDSKFLISTSDNSIRLIEALTLTAIGQPLRGHGDKIRSVALRGDGGVLASGSWDGTVRLWDMEHLREICALRPANRAWVSSVSFNRAGTLLYSAILNEAPGGAFLHYAETVRDIFVWDTTFIAENVAIPLVHKFTHDSMYGVLSLRMNRDESELFAFAPCQVLVWNTKPTHDGYVARAAEPESFLNDVLAFGISADGATLATNSEQSQVIEVRDVSEVSHNIDRVLAQYEIPEGKQLIDLAVSDDKKFVAFAVKGSCVVHLANLQTRMAELAFYDLQQWANSLPLVSRIHEKCIEAIHFSSPDVITAHACLIDYSNEGPNEVAQSFSWKLLPAQGVRGSFDSSRLSNRFAQMSVGMNPGYTDLDQMMSKRLSVRMHSDVIELRDGMVYSAVASLEHSPVKTHYSAHTSRLWVSKRGCGLAYVDLIRKETMLEEEKQPALPIFTEQVESRSMAESNQAEEETFRVFISHAGPDKMPLGIKIYENLKKEGISVFFDREELKPGDEAPQKMIDAMENADVFVFIASPEFPARTWTVRELVCALRRFDEAKEKGVAGPVLIPAFYRLSISACKSNLFAMTDEEGRNIFMREGTFERIHDGVVTYEEVSGSIQRLPTFTGIENIQGATNAKEDEEKRDLYAKRVAGAVVNVVNDEGKRAVRSGAGASVRRQRFRSKFTGEGYVN